MDFKVDNKIEILQNIAGIYGNEKNNTFIGSKFSEWIIGNAGADTLYGNEGDDTIYGGYIETNYNFSWYSLSHTNPDLGDSLFGGDGNDKIYGQDGNDFMDGGTGNDYLEGDAGADTMFGGDGDDTLVTDGLDVIDGGAGYDIVKLDPVAVGTSVDWNNIIAHAQNVEEFQGGNGNDAMTGTAASDSLNGGAGNDSLFGGAGNDTLLGSDGNDTLNGGDGNDLLIGGVGDDVLIGGAGIDTASYVDSSAAVTVNLAITTAQNTFGAGIDTISGVENLVGSAFADTLTGDAGANTIDGGDGNDTIDGGLGHDTLTGGAGADFFIFGSGITSGAGQYGTSVNIQGSSDTITDFQHGIDQIVLKLGVFDLIGAPGQHLSASQFVGTGVYAQDADDRITYNKGTGEIWYDFNGNAAVTDSSGTWTGKYLLAKVAAGTVLDANDFLLVA